MLASGNSARRRGALQICDKREHHDNSPWNFGAVAIRWSTFVHRARTDSVKKPGSAFTPRCRLRQLSNNQVVVHGCH
jgi:hypothetical protein